MIRMVPRTGAGISVSAMRWMGVALRRVRKEVDASKGNIAKKTGDSEVNGGAMHGVTKLVAAVERHAATPAIVADAAETASTAACTAKSSDGHRSHIANR